MEADDVSDRGGEKERSKYRSEDSNNAFNNTFCKYIYI